MTKLCSICKIIKNTNEFNKRKHSSDGLRSECKLCRKNNRLNNLEKYKKKDKEYRDKNKIKIRKRSINYYYNNIDKKKKYDKNYYLLNKDKIINNHNEQNIKRRKIDINFKIKTNISNSIYKKLKNIKNNKSCLKYLPFTIQELKEHIEKQFEPWMNWNNWGIYNIKTWNDNDQLTWKWQIDHIVPHSEFKYNSMNDIEFKNCWTLNNLRPYSAKQNVLDGTAKKRHACKNIIK